MSMRPSTIKDRYQLRESIGYGDIGLVYRAYDRIMRREVAIKTLRDAPSPTVLDLFYRECGVLAGLVHPNIVEILDIGEYDHEGVSRPFFVMPLLPGRTLHDLIHQDGQPLSPERVVEICTQACRALQAAHDNGLLHRDVKPRNIFVIDEFSVKLVDFGIAHLLESGAGTRVKGTLEYMAPEQLSLNALSPATDVFAIGTTGYEALTATQPFRRDSAYATAEAVLNYHPPLASDLNEAVPRLLAQVVSKAMAKDPRFRFFSASEFGDALQRAVRNESNHIFDSSGAKIRLERARRCFEHKDLTFASDLLRELESEGQFTGEIAELRQQVDAALRSETATRLLGSARRCVEEQEYSLALRKLEAILDLEPNNAEVRSIKAEVESALKERRATQLLPPSRLRKNGLFVELLSFYGKI